MIAIQVVHKDSFYTGSAHGDCDTGSAQRFILYRECTWMIVIQGVHTDDCDTGSAQRFIL